MANELRAWEIHTRTGCNSSRYASLRGSSNFGSALVFVYSFRRSEGGACFLSKELEAEIFAVGKAFEQDPKAIHLHAEIENKEGLMIPGMYVRGRIMVDKIEAFALPNGGVVRDGEKFYLFTVEKEEEENGEIEWEFEPVEIAIGNEDDGWTEVKPLKAIEEGTVVAWNNAYYLLAEMKKGEAEHEH